MKDDAEGEGPECSCTTEPIIRFISSAANRCSSSLRTPEVYTSVLEFKLIIHDGCTAELTSPELQQAGLSTPDNLVVSAGQQFSKFKSTARICTRSQVAYLPLLSLHFLVIGQLLFKILDAPLILPDHHLLIVVRELSTCNTTSRSGTA